MSFNSVSSVRSVFLEQVSLRQEFIEAREKREHSLFEDNFNGLVCVSFEQLVDIMKLNSGRGYYRHAADILEMGCYPSCLSHTGSMGKDHSKIRPRFDKLIETAKRIRDAEQRPSTFLAGGSILSAMLGIKTNDLDFFFSMSPDTMKSLKLISRKNRYHVSTIDRQLVRNEKRISRELQINRNGTFYHEPHCGALASTFTSGYIGGVAVQLIRKLYMSVSECINSFDIPICQMALVDGEVWMTKIALACLVNRMIYCDATYSSTSYIHRIIKYMGKDFHVVPHRLIRYEQHDIDVLREEYKILSDIFCHHQTTMGGHIDNVCDHHPPADLLEKIDMEDLDIMITSHPAYEKGNGCAMHHQYQNFIISSIRYQYRHLFTQISCYDSIWMHLDREYMDVFTANLINEEGQSVHINYYDIANLNDAESITPSFKTRFYLKGCIPGALKGLENKLTQDEWLGSRCQIAPESMIKGRS